MRKQQNKTISNMHFPNATKSSYKPEELPDWNWFDSKEHFFYAKDLNVWHQTLEWGSFKDDTKHITIYSKQRELRDHDLIN